MEILYSSILTIDLLIFFFQLTQEVGQRATDRPVFIGQIDSSNLMKSKVNSPHESMNIKILGFNE